MITIENDTVIVQEPGQPPKRMPIGSREAFEVLSRLWVRSGWEAKHIYSFTWLGRPIIQLPEDLLRVQEILYDIKPDVIVETGIAHGGSLIFYASLCKLFGKGRVIGVDIDIRAHNRRAIEAHELFPYITLIQGSSIDRTIVDQVEGLIQPGESVFVMLDSHHSKEHVRAELDAYSPLVSVGSYIVAADGIMADLAGAERSEPDWTWNNPSEAAREFAAANPNFELREPAFRFNEGLVQQAVTHWPDAYLRRLR